MSRHPTRNVSPQPQAGPARLAPPPAPSHRTALSRWAVRAAVLLGLLAAGWLPLSCSTDESVLDLFTYSLGFTVSGLNGTGMVVQNNAADDVTVLADGDYTFPTKLATGESYDVQVSTQPSPAGEQCDVSSGSGTMPAQNWSAISVTCTATSGTLIQGFGTTGVLIFDNGGTADMGNALVVGPYYLVPDHIYVTGASGGTTDENGDMAVWAIYNNSSDGYGVVDTNFDTDGLATFANPTNPTGGDIGRGIAHGTYNSVQGRLAIAGSAQSNASAPTEKNGAFWVVNSLTGALVSNTYVDVPASGQDQEIFDINWYLTSPYMAGRARSTGGPAWDFMTAWRMRTDSPVLDTTTWPPNGYVSYDGGIGDDIGVAITYDESGGGGTYNLFVAGIHSRSSTPGDTTMGLWRMDYATGALDGTFGTGGRVDYPAGLSTEVAAGNAVDVQEDAGTPANAKIVVAGYTMASGGDKDLAVWRFNLDGTPDTNFGGGCVTHDGAAGATGSEDEGLGVALDPSGTIYVTGGSVNAEGDFDMVVWSFNSDGTPNSSFGTGGVAVFDGTAGNTTAGAKHDLGTAIIYAFPPGGTSYQLLVSGGSTNANGDTDMVVWALNP